MDLYQDYKEWIRAAEDVWSDVVGGSEMGGKGGSSKVSRSEGPKFIWVPATGRLAVNAWGVNQELVQWMAIANHLRTVYVLSGKAPSMSQRRGICKARPRLENGKSGCAAC